MCDEIRFSTGPLRMKLTGGCCDWCHGWHIEIPETKPSVTHFFHWSVPSGIRRKGELQNS